MASVTTTEPEWSELDYAWMEALTIYEASLCPGCNRPIDVCAAEYAAGVAYIVDSHICTATLSRAVQQRVDEWENTDRDKRPGQMPTDAQWHDGRMYAPHLAAADGT